jgi:hypothetical protein
VRVGSGPDSFFFELIFPGLSGDETGAVSWSVDSFPLATHAPRVDLVQHAKTSGSVNVSLLRGTFTTANSTCCSAT